jgi:hypothetical protein
MCVLFLFIWFRRYVTRTYLATGVLEFSIFCLWVAPVYFLTTPTGKHSLETPVIWGICLGFFTFDM